MTIPTVTNYSDVRLTHDAGHDLVRQIHSDDALAILGPVTSAIIEHKTQLPSVLGPVCIGQRIPCVWLYPADINTHKPVKAWV